MRDHFETFRAQTASLRDGEGLPRFVEQEFRDFLRCGCLPAALRAFGVLACPRCGGRLRLVALIEQASVIQGILRHIGLPTDEPEPRPHGRPPAP